MAEERLNGLRIPSVWKHRSPSDAVKVRVGKSATGLFW